MDTLILLLVPFGALALLAGAGAACAAVRASAVEDDAGRSFELWGLCVVLTVVTILCAGSAWWWWAGWSDFGF